MLYRRFGRTEINMPVFSTGGMRYQQNWKDIPLDEVTDENQANLEATIRRSIELGINHIETARGYGSSERQLGVILPTFPREELIIQTKIGPRDDAGEFRREFEDSLARLKLDHVDLLSIHGINEESTTEQSLKPGGCLEMCRQLQSEGLARWIGFSTHGRCDTIVNAINTEVAGGFDYVNLHWYWIFQHNWPAVLAARARDMGVFLISPSDKGGMLYKPPKKLEELTAPLHPLVFNDLWCLDHPEVHTLSLGAAKPSDYDLHLEAVGLYEQREELLPPILERLEAEKLRVMGEDFVANFGKNMPWPDETPGGVNVPVIAWLHGLAKTYDMIEYGQMRYNLLGNAGHWFPGQKLGEDPDATLAKIEVPDTIKIRLREADALLRKEEVKRLSES